MPSEDPIESVAKGATSAALSWTESKISALVRKFKQGELSFIQDEETIDLVKKEKNTPENELYKKYISQRDYRLLVQMGLCLRRLEPEPEKNKKLRDKITGKYGQRGLHIAQVVQSGLFKRLVDLLLGSVSSDIEMNEGIASMLDHIDKYVVFVKAGEPVSLTKNALLQRINANLPKAVVIFSRGQDAIENADQIFTFIKENVCGYEFEEQLSLEKCQKYQFIIKKNTDMLIT
ncbi:MAG: hypothetical protein WC408_02965 [Candidatus Micrarchaeia archaeon]|jgi:hypothetical protein